MSSNAANVLITGGAGAIGMACARRYLAAGARVMIADSDQVGLARACDALGEDASSSRRRLAAVCVDISRVRDCERMVDEAERAFGAPLALCIATAGVPFSGSLLEADADDLRRVIEVNVTGSLLTAQAALRSLVRVPGASLLLTGSLQSIMGRAQRSAYTASKHAIAGLVKALALEFGPCGVRVNGIAPTVIDTPFFRAAYERVGLDVASGLERVAAGLPLGRVPTAEDFAETAWFLASPAAGSITGQMLMLDCGASAGRS